jgi:MFS transporter, FLVCR family, feline leukemia virus subgroup C receptor-related protein
VAGPVNDIPNANATMAVTQEKDVAAGTRVYAQRWLMLSLFVLFSMSSAYQWIHINIIGDVALYYWNASLPADNPAFAIDWLSMVYMLAYVPLILPASSFLNRFGLRYSAVLGSALNAIGAWLKCAALSPDRFAVLMTGQTVCAIAQLFVLNMPPRLAAVWFGPDELSTATSLGVFGNQVGCAIGFLLPPLFAHVDPDLAVTHRGLATMLYSTAAVTTVIFVLISICTHRRNFTSLCLRNVHESCLHR